MTTTADPPVNAAQLSFDELGTPLRDTTFVVVDLETTGASANEDAITEKKISAMPDWKKALRTDFMEKARKG